MNIQGKLEQWLHTTDVDVASTSAGDLIDDACLAFESYARSSVLRGLQRALKAVLDRPEHTHIGVEEIDDAPEARGDRVFEDWSRREYLFLFNGWEPFDVPFEEMDSLIRAYVRSGSAMSQMEVCRWAWSDEYQEAHGSRRRLDHRCFQKMLRALDVQKNSPPFAPHRAKEETVEQLVGSHRIQQEATLLHKIDQGNRSFFEAKYKEQLKNDRRLLSRLADVHPNVESISFDIQVESRRDVDSNLEPCHPLIIISDWHIGALVRMPGNNLYDKEVAQERLSKLRFEVEEYFHTNRRPVEGLTIAICGDMCDGPMGDMRAGQQHEQDLHYHEQSRATVRALAEFLAFVRGLFPDVPIHVPCVPGNHGRGTANKADDPVRLVEIMIYQNVEDCVAEQLQMEFNICADVLNIFYIYSTQVIQTHGDRITKNVERLIRAAMDKRATHHLMISGHFHSETEKTMDVLADSFAVRSGSIMGDTPYGLQQLGLSSRPSQRIIEIRKSIGPLVPGTLVLE
jgi:hypothetical protein